MLIYNSQVIPPIFEAKDDVEIAVEVGKRLGLDPMAIQPISKSQADFQPTGRSKGQEGRRFRFRALLTITKEDIDEIGAEGEPQKGRISYQEFSRRQVFSVKRARTINLGTLNCLVSSKTLWLTLSKPLLANLRSIAKPFPIGSRIVALI